MTAKEMFEKLNFKKYEDACTIKYINKISTNYKVRFWKESKHIELFDNLTQDMFVDDTEYFEDTFELFIAINKQIEELGWNKC